MICMATWGRGGGGPRGGCCFRPDLQVTICRRSTLPSLKSRHSNLDYLQDEGLSGETWGSCAAPLCYCDWELAMPPHAPSAEV